MRHLVTAAVMGLALAVVTTAIAEPPAPVHAAKAKKCFKKKHGKRVRVKCKKKRPATRTPTTPESPTSPPPAAPQDVTGQEAIDRETGELKGGKWVFYTSGSQSSTQYVLNLCADGTFLRTGESLGVLVYRYGTWKVTDAAILADGTRRGAHVSGTVSESDPPPDGSTYEADLIAVHDADGDQWYVNDLAAQYFPGAARCHD